MKLQVCFSFHCLKNFKITIEMKNDFSFMKSLIEKSLHDLWQERPIILSATQKKMLLTCMLLTNVLIACFALERSWSCFNIGILNAT